MAAPRNRRLFLFVPTFLFLALGRIGPAAHGAEPALIAALGDPDVGSGWIVEALWRIGSDVVSALTRVLETGDNPARKAALVELARLGSLAAAPLPNPKANF